MSNQEIENDTLRLNWLKTQLKMITNEIQGILKEIDQLDCDDFSKWFARECIKLFVAVDIPMIEKEIYQLKRKLNPRKISSNFEKALEEARKIPIMEVADWYLTGIKKRGNRYIAFCPFHEENTASFTIFPDTNTYHCFGCLEHGDAISLVQHINNITFQEAVALLNTL